MENKSQLYIYIYSNEINFYKNEYTEKFRTGMFKETININPVTCVYKQWETTQYLLSNSVIAAA